MPDTVSDGSSFTCPFCPNKLKLQVPSSALLGDGKNIGNSSDTLFPPPGGPCNIVPGAPTPCTPVVNNADPGQNPFNILGLSALGLGCMYMCAKGGLITRDSCTQSSAKHDEGYPALGGDGLPLRDLHTLDSGRVEEDKDIPSLGADLLPGISTIKSGTEVITGKDPITGKKTSRVLAGIGIIPYGKIVAKGGKLAGKGLWKLGKKLFGGGKKKSPPKPPRPEPSPPNRFEKGVKLHQDIKNYLKDMKTVKRDQLIKDLEKVGLERVDRRDGRITFVKKRKKDEDRVMVQIHPPDSETPYHHIHIYNRDVEKGMEEAKKRRKEKGKDGPLAKHEKDRGRCLNSSLKPVPCDSKEAHIEYGGP